MKKFTTQVLPISLFLVLCFGLSSYAQQPQILETQSYTGHLMRITPKLSDIDRTTMYGKPLVITRDKDGIIGIGERLEETEERIEAKFRNANPNKITEGIQKPGTIFPNVPGSSITASFDGQTSPGLSPTDNNMAAGPNHVIQIVNDVSGAAFTIYNKTGTVVQPKTVLATITGFPGFGDPVVLYDQLADRWVMMEFGPNTLPIHTLNIAVSTTPNPTGTWAIYQYVDLTFFIDYEKMSVWHNAYYLTSNDFNNAGNAYLGSSVYSMDRAAMIAGAPTAVMIRTRLNDAGNNFYNMGTIGLEGMTPSSQNGLFSYPIGPTTLNIFEVTPNFGGGTQVIGPNTALAIAAYATPPANVIQQGGASANTLGERFMFKLSYRNNSGTESVVITHTVGNGALAAVRWYELRRVAAVWTVFQQGTVTGADGNSRWMGGISMDGCGNIALMYDVTGPTAFPSMRYTGRNASDPLGTMPLAEQTIINGVSAHSGNARWGDYNTTVQDYTAAGSPNNGSFWSTSQYGNQLTRIANYTLTGGCSATPNIIAGTATLTAEGCVPNNAVIDPGETVTVSFCALNTGTANTVNLVGTMQASGGVTPISGPQNYGVLVFGGAAVCRSFSFSNTSSTCGGTITVSIQWQDGATNLGTSTWTFTLGTTVVSSSQNFDAVVAPALPAGWIATNVSGPAPLWVTSSAGTPAPPAVSLPNAIFIDDPGAISDKQIVTPSFTPGTGARVSFANNYLLESTFDGGVLEISINGGAFQDIITAGGSFVTGGYTGVISASFGNPLASRNAWTGTSSGFITTTVNLPVASFGQPCVLKFRMGSDNSVAATGWRVDDYSVTQPACCGAVCTITCPANISTGTGPGATSCGTIVNYPAATTTGLCGAVTYSQNSGTFFPVGTTTVTATTAAGPSCTFTVTVVDNTPPTITCPANITRNNDAGLCSAVVTYSSPSTLDNCGSGTVSDFSNPWTNSGQRGVYFDVTNLSGSPITISRLNPAMWAASALNETFSVYFTTSATTWNGNQANAGAWTLNTTASVSFPGGATPVQVPVILTTPLVLAAGQSKGVFVVATAGFGGGPNAYLSTAAGYAGSQSYSDGTLRFTGGIGTDGLFGGNFFGTGAAGNFRLYYGSVTYGTPLPLTQLTGLPSGSAFPVGVTTNTFRATDAAGNTSTCSFTVTVVDNQAPTLVCPTNITQNTDVGACVATVVTPNPPTLSDNCAVTTLTWSITPPTGPVINSLPTGINFVGTRTFGLNGTTGQGISTVTYTAKDAAGNTTTCSFTVTVNDAWIPVISIQPSNQFVCVGSNGAFTVTASVPAGNPLTYQWQTWTGPSGSPANTWVDIVGATAASLPLNAVPFSLNTTDYRVILTGRCSIVTSGFATLYVNPLPMISLLASRPLALVPGNQLTLTAVVSPGGGTYQWKKNGSNYTGPGATSSTLSNLTVDDIGSYTCTYTDGNGCVKTSDAMVVTGEASNKIWLYPNPNFGVFQIRFFNSTNEAVNVGIYNSVGQQVKTIAVTTGLSYSKIDVDISNLSAGEYNVAVINSAGKRVGAKKFVLIKQ